jgi:predicted RNA polymerase sigma factor
MTDIPAFPHTIEHLHEPKTTGMTLRDYFAAKAMQGILFEGLGERETAESAYAMADAMMRARNAAQ